MKHPYSTPRAERRAAIGQRPTAFARHGQSAGTARVRAHLAKPARASHGTRLALRPSKPAQAGLEPRPTFPLGDRTTYSPGEGQT
jgi:hypothetical protein